MKTILQITALIFLLFLGVTSCSDDESEKIDIPREPQRDEMKVIFNTTLKDSEALFYISGNCLIDWGDGKKSTIRDDNNIQEIRHHYDGRGKEYIITIKTSEALESFRNFSVDSFLDLKEDETPLYECITIGSAVEIKNLYLQTSGVKKINIENKLSIGDANLLLGAVKWDLSMINSKYLSIYVANKRDLDIENLVTQHLSITIKDDVNNLSITSCENLETVAISAKYPTKPTINNLSITSLPLLNDLRLYSLTGKDAILTDLSRLELTLLNRIDYETIDFTNNIKSTTKMSLEAEGLNASKSFKLSKQLVAIDINNRQLDVSEGAITIDFSICPELESININSMQSLNSLKFGIDNHILDKVTLQNVTNLKSMDLSDCENIRYVEVNYATSLSNVKFSSRNQYLADVKCRNTNFTELNCIDMVNTLPKSYIPNIPTVNRRRLSIRDNNPSLKDNSAVLSAVEDLNPYWVKFID